MDNCYLRAQNYKKKSEHTIRHSENFAILRFFDYNLLRGLTEKGDHISCLKRKVSVSYYSVIFCIITLIFVPFTSHTNFVCRRTGNSLSSS